MSQLLDGSQPERHVTRLHRYVRAASYVRRQNRSSTVPLTTIVQSAIVEYGTWRYESATGNEYGAPTTHGLDRRRHQCNSRIGVDVERVLSV